MAPAYGTEMNQSTIRESVGLKCSTCRAQPVVQKGPIWPINEGVRNNTLRAVPSLVDSHPLFSQLQHCWLVPDTAIGPPGPRCDVFVMLSGHSTRFRTPRTW